MSLQQWQTKKRSLGVVSSQVRGYGISGFGDGGYGIGLEVTVSTDLSPIWNMRGDSPAFTASNKSDWQKVNSTTTFNTKNPNTWQEKKP